MLLKSSPSLLSLIFCLQRAEKWKTIFQRFGDFLHEGSGIKFLPADINGLQTKLAYLLGEFQAGNTAATRNEIVSISDELLRRKNISQSEYRRINDFLQQ